MPELARADPPARPTPRPASAHTAALAPTHDPDAPDAGTRGRPSRLIPFLAFGSISLLLFAVAGILRRDPEPLPSALGDYSCLGACLSCVAAAIFGCVTLARAARGRRR